MNSILVIEDDAAIREALCLALSEEGFSVEEAPDGAAAWDWLQKHPRPDLIILDLSMPIMDGYEFRERQREDLRFAAVPTLVCTAGVVDPRLHLPEPTPVIAKPFLLEDMFEAIRSTIGAAPGAGV